MEDIQNMVGMSLSFILGILLFFPWATYIIMIAWDCKTYGSIVLEWLVFTDGIVINRIVIINIIIIIVVIISILIVIQLVVEIADLTCEFCQSVGRFNF